MGDESGPSPTTRPGASFGDADPNDGALADLYLNLWLIRDLDAEHAVPLNHSDALLAGVLPPDVITVSVLDNVDLEDSQGFEVELVASDADGATTP